MKWKQKILITRPMWSIPDVWRQPLGVDFNVESMFNVKKCQVLHPKGKIKENQTKINFRGKNPISLYAIPKVSVRNSEPWSRRSTGIGRNDSNKPPGAC